jgi:hypothetical protein
MSSFAFILFVSQMGALMGQTIVSDAPTPPIPSGIADAIVTNFAYFFTLMTISSGYAFVGLILSVLFAGMIWAIVEVIRGV